MILSSRLAIFVIGVAFAAISSASPDLVRLRSGVGISGVPIQLSGNLDVNRNGRPELLVSGRFHVSFVEEDEGPRGYHEVSRVDAPGGSSVLSTTSFVGAMLVNVPGAEPAILLRWTDRSELRDTATLAIKGVLPGTFDSMAIGDVDGDGIPEIVVAFGLTVGLYNPETLALDGSFTLLAAGIAVADIVGDPRAEIISNDARAYTVTRSGTSLSTEEIWNAHVTGVWNPYVIHFQGRAALVLHDAAGRSTQLATFRPQLPLQLLVSTSGPPFNPLFADANGDGSVDLITSTGYLIRAFDIATGLLLWERNPYQIPRLGFVSSPVTVDLDGDGTVEMAWADTTYNSDVLAVSLPLHGAPRWRSDTDQTRVKSWSSFMRADGEQSIAYLTGSTVQSPSLASVGFLDGFTFADQGGSAFAWLPGYDGMSRRVGQFGITAFPLETGSVAILVIGAEFPLFGGNPLARLMWTFNAKGEFLSERTLLLTVTPYHAVAAQVLDRPERQLVVAGPMPEATTGPANNFTRVEVIDYATGAVLWQSIPLPTPVSLSATKMQVADLDADGQPEIVFSYGNDVTVLKPAAGPGGVASYAAQQFSLLDLGAGHTVKLATLDRTTINVYDGLSTSPEKTFELPSPAYGVALFTQAPEDDLMFATSNSAGTTVRSFADGEIVASNANFASYSLDSMDADSDNRIELIGSDLKIWQLENDYLFRGGFDDENE